MNYVVETIKSRKEPNTLMKVVIKAFKNKAKKQNSWLLRIVLGFNICYVRKVLTAKGLKAKIPKRGVIRAGEGTAEEV